MCCTRTQLHAAMAKYGIWYSVKIVQRLNNIHGVGGVQFAFSRCFYIGFPINVPIHALLCLTVFLYRSISSLIFQFNFFLSFHFHQQTWKSSKMYIHCSLIRFIISFNFDLLFWRRILRGIRLFYICVCVYVSGMLKIQMRKRREKESGWIWCSFIAFLCLFVLTRLLVVCLSSLSLSLSLPRMETKMVIHILRHV